MRWEFWKAILILPGFALVYAPALWLWLAHGSAWAAHPLWSRSGLLAGLGLLAGFCLLAAGLALMVRCMQLFHATGSGSIAPWHPVGRFIVAGPYRYLRNPMLAGVNLVLAAEALLLASWPLLLWLLVFFVLNTAYFILKEEPQLLRRYGDAYRRYRHAVPRWLPRLTPYRDDPAAPG